MISEELFIYFLSRINPSLLKLDTFTRKGWEEWCKAHYAPKDLPIHPDEVYENWHWDNVHVSLGLLSREARSCLIDYYKALKKLNRITEREYLVYLQLVAKDMIEHPSVVHSGSSHFSSDLSSYPYCGFWIEKIDDKWEVRNSESGEKLQIFEFRDLAEKYVHDLSYDECLKRSKATSSLEIETLSDEKIEQIQKSILVSTYLTDEFWEETAAGRMPTIQVPDYRKPSRFYTNLKKELLEMAEQGKSKPEFSSVDKIDLLNEEEVKGYVKNIELCAFLLGVTNPESEKYDSNFVERLQQVAPFWLNGD